MCWYRICIRPPSYGFNLGLSNIINRFINHWLKLCKLLIDVSRITSNLSYAAFSIAYMRVICNIQTMWKKNTSLGLKVPELDIARLAAQRFVFLSNLFSTHESTILSCRWLQGIYNKVDISEQQLL